MESQMGKHSHVATAQIMRRIDGKSFELAFIPAITWLLVGGFADAWGHNHVPNLETFFTLWHAVLYSGYALVTGVMMGTVLLNRARGSSWMETIPKGYEYALVGIVGFLFGGIGDMLWHIGFGVEQGVSALFSPTHILLMMSFGLIVLGPFRARYLRRGQPSNLRDHLWLAVSVSLFLAALVDISQTTHPFYVIWAQYPDTGIPLPHPTQSGEFWPQTIRTLDDITQLKAMLGFLLQAIMMVGFLLHTIRRFTITTFGFFTFVWVAIAVPLYFMGDHVLVIPIGGLTGLILDVGYHFLRPSVQSAARFRLFAVLSAATMPAVYMLMLSLFGGLAWTIHMRVGAVFVTGITGFLLSYLVLPPPHSGAEKSEEETFRV